MSEHATVTKHKIDGADFKTINKLLSDLKEIDAQIATLRVASKGAYDVLWEKLRAILPPELHEDEKHYLHLDETHKDLGFLVVEKRKSEKPRIVKTLRKSSR